MDTEAIRDNRRALRERANTQPRAATNLAPVRGLSNEEITHELMAMKAVLEELARSRPPRERALSLLDSMGIEGALARELAKGAPKHAAEADGLRTWLANRLKRKIKIESDLLKRPGQQAIACVGPTGVGKTTTLAKIAARARLELRRSVGVISLDGYRVGAVEQWQRYANIMGIPFHSAQNATEFRQAAATMRCDLLLIDTAGPSNADAEGWNTLETCLKHKLERPLHTQLVLPAWIRGSDAEQSVRRFHSVGLGGVVVSKLDETTLRGGFLHAVVPSDLPVTFLCNGPRVPEDLHIASTESVLAAVLTPES
jgi:flagellar biosynthesis protein FlhF